MATSPLRMLLQCGGRMGILLLAGEILELRAGQWILGTSKPGDFSNYRAPWMPWTTENDPKCETDGLSQIWLDMGT